MTKSFSKMENREEVAKQSLSLQILGAQLLVQVRLPLHNMFQRQNYTLLELKGVISSIIDEIIKLRKT